MKYQNIRLLISSTCVILAFFFGYLYALRQHQLDTDKTSLPQYIDISTSTRNITIKNNPENIFFRVNGELIQSGSIDLK